ncbi:MAG: hypothetical protein LBF78_04435 [Treponema sp.]|nr:hypothetical protein [Treponema sp.]
MGKKIICFAISLAVLGIIALIFFSFFEIRESPVYFPPSREARTNQFLALSNWLKGEGFSVRISGKGNLETLLAAREGTIFIRTENMEWPEAVSSFLNLWIEDGGILVLSLDWDFDENETLAEFVNNLGVEEEEEEEWEYNYDPLSPSYGGNISFKEKEGALNLKDNSNYVRLVQLEKGKGKVTVIGWPRFMISNNVGEEPNARLSWYLLADNGAQKDGILFIAGKRQADGLVDGLFRRGNLIFVIISALVVIVVGFWQVIPLFGVVRPETLEPGKSLQSRFLAEARFLKSYGGLDSYRFCYIREIKKRLRKEDIAGDGEISAKLPATVKETVKEKKELDAALSAEKQKPKYFLKQIRILKIILENL